MRTRGGVIHPHISVVHSVHITQASVLVLITFPLLDAAVTKYAICNIITMQTSQSSLI